MGTSEADAAKQMLADAKQAAETPAGANATSSADATDLVQDSAGGSVGLVGSGGSSPPAKAPQTTPTSSAKKQAGSRAKKTKEGTSSGSKKAAASPAASGLRGISSFLVGNLALLCLRSLQASGTSARLCLAAARRTLRRVDCSSITQAAWSCCKKHGVLTSLYVFCAGADGKEG